MDNIFILLLGLGIDLVLGDPPTFIHPVGWMGKVISASQRLGPKSGKKAQFTYGMVIVIIGTGIFTVPVYFLLSYLDDINRIVFIIAGALILKSTFSIKGLRSSAARVKRELKDHNLKGARCQMPALVSRNPQTLDETAIIAATVESVAENTSDSFVAPLFWFLIFGVPGAVAYRMINTFDSMIGYHGEYEYPGKFAARLDDVLNLIPARLAGLILVVAAFLTGKSGLSSWKIMIRDHSRTRSPNAGWPMSAAAGALGIQLEKVGHYKLGDAEIALTIETIDAMLRLMYLVVLIWGLLCFAGEGVRFVLAS